MQIQFAEIPEEGLAVKVDDVSWFPEREVARSGDLRVEVFLERHGARILVRGSIDVNLQQVCDRCLEEFIRPLHIDFSLILEQATGVEGVEADGHGGDHSETDLVLVDQPVVDLSDLLYQQLLLALPVKVLCRPDCLGLCENCGANLNREGCRCSEKPEASAFSALGRLLKDKK